MRFIASALLPALLALSLSAQETASEGVVIGVVGKWRIAGVNQPISFGASLKPGTEVERYPPGSTTGSLTILFGATTLTYSCEDPATLPKGHSLCSQPFPLVVAKTGPEAPQNSKLMALFLALPQMFAREPNRYYAAVSRDYGVLQDAVVKSTPNGVDLAPAVRGLSKGEYRIVFQSLAPGKSTAVSSTPVTIQTDPDNNRPILGPDLPPGLYDLQVESADQEPVGHAWVLVASANDFASKSAAYDEVTKVTLTWNSNVPAAGIRAVNRAALDRLSR